MAMKKFGRSDSRMHADDIDDETKPFTASDRHRIMRDAIDETRDQDGRRDR